MFDIPGQATTQTQATRRASTAARPRSILLVLALLAALGAPLTGAAVAAAPTADTLELTPVKARTDVKKPVRYTAELVNDKGRFDVTSRTTLYATGPAPCHQDHGDLSCDDNGSYEVTGVLDDPAIKSEPVALEVVNPGVEPAFEPPPPASPPNREVRVQGHTGSCSQKGTLSSAELEVDQDVTGIFTATFSIPSGTFPGTYPLSLEVRCDGKPQGAQVLITVSNEPPDAVNDVDTVRPGGSVRIPVTANDTDPDGDDGYKTLLEADRPTVGTADPAGEVIVYTPGPGFVDRDQFTYRNCDVVGKGKTACGEASIVVTKPPPEPKGDRARTEQGKEVSILVTENDGSPEPAKLRVRTDPKHGAAVVKEPRDGNIVYTPEQGFAGEDSFEYDYCEGVVTGPNVAAPDACPSATITIEVIEPLVLPAIEKVTLNPTPPNREVVVTGTTGSCSQSGTLILHIPSPGSDVSAPVSGRRGGAFETTLMVPGGTFVDTYELKLQVDCQGTLQTDQETLAVDNRAPDAVDDRAETPQGVAVTIDVTANDTDPDGDDGYKTSLDASQPAHGSTEVLPGDQIRYTPDPGFSGDDPFTYTLCDIVTAAGKRACDTATVTVTVIGDRRPQPVDDPDQSTVKETEVLIPVTGNDIDPDPERLQVRTDPREGGTAVVQDPPRDGHILYRPPKGFTGTDSFTYDYCRSVVGVTARSACRFATVTVDVKPPRVDPRIDLVDPAASPPNGEVLVEGTTGTCERAATLALDSRPKAVAPVAVTGGQDGAFEAKLTVPPGTYVGTYQLGLHVVCDGKADVVEHGLRVANQPPRAVDDPATTTEGVAVTIDVTANDTDPDGDDGYGTSLQPVKPANGRLDAEPGKPLVYTPEGGFIGVDRFTYRLCDIVDAAGAVDCGTATVTVTVKRRQPVPVDDPGVETERDRPVVVEVMRNDRDPDPALLQAQPPARSGARAEKQADGTVRYTPEAGFSGADTFTYDYCGGPVGVTSAGGACPSATVTVTVIGTQIPPKILSVKPASTSAGKAVKVSGNTGSCNRAGTLALQGTGVAVTVAGGQDGAFTTSLTVPAGTFPGPHTLELGVDCKGQPQRAEAQLTVTNQRPVAADDTARTARDQAKRIPVTDNDRDPDDPDGYRTLLLVTRQPEHGTAEPQPDLTVVYTPEPGFVGTDRFTYSLCDDVLNAARGADCGAATVTVTVTGTGPPPVAPEISSVEPGSTSPGKPVEIVGNTGSCGRAGTLTLSGGTGLRESVTGDQDGRFAVTITVPGGTFPGPYKLALDVDCKGQVQRAEADLMVTNQAPVAADDQVTTTPGTATTIDVTDNDRDPDDPDTYPAIVVVTGQPDQGTAEARPDLSIVYTPGPGFVGTDRFTYSLCDDVLNAAGQADCGTATVTVRVDPIACAPSAGDISSLRVEPGRGPDGTRLRITAVADPRLATCQLRLLLGGTPLAPDVTVGDDGSISADRGVPRGLKPGPNLMRLATLTADTLAETSFEVLDALPPPGPLLPPWLVRLLLSAGAVAAGFLARAAFAKWGKSAEDRERRRDRSVEQPDDLRARPYTRPVEVAVEPVPDNTRTLAVRLEPHPDPGIQTVQTFEEVTP